MLSFRMSGGLDVLLDADERRRHRRYPLRLEVRYKLLHVGHTVQTGSGRTVNLSTGGVLFEVDRALPLRNEIMLDIAWPALLDGVQHLKVVASGRVVRSEGRTVAVRIRTFEFRTRRITKLSPVTTKPF